MRQVLYNNSDFEECHRVKCHQRLRHRWVWAVGAVMVRLPSLEAELWAETRRLNVCVHVFECACA